MAGRIYPLLAALASGITMAIQGSLNSVMGKIIGLWEATFVVHLVGTVVVGALILALKLGSHGFSRITAAPWYTFLGGFLNVAIIYLVVTSIPRLGVAVATTAIIVGQVLTAMIIDHFGLFGLDKIPYSWLKLVGVVLLAAGAKLMLNTR